MGGDILVAFILIIVMICAIFVIKILVPLLSKDDEVPLFLIYSFTIPLVCVLIMKIIGKYNCSVFTFILYGVEAASPALSAILVIFKKHGIQGLKQFFWKSYINNFNIKICIIGLGTPAIMLTISKFFTYLTPNNNYFWYPISIKKLIIIVWALIAEELGWRGFLQKRIEGKLNAFITPAIVGVIWTLWHYHFFILGSMDVPIVLFAYGCIAESYGYYVITKFSKENIIPASLWHFSGNLFFNIYRFNPDWNNGSTVPYLIVSVVYFLYLILFMWYRHNETKIN